MVPVLVLVLLFVALGLAAARWGADTRDGRDWQLTPEPSTSPARPDRRRTLARAAWRRLRGFWGEQLEAQQRLILLARPWEEEYLHWSARDGEPRLHGTVVPPRHGRRYSTTAGGWCPDHGGAGPDQPRSGKVGRVQPLGDREPSSGRPADGTDAGPRR